MIAEINLAVERRAFRHYLSRTRHRRLLVPMVISLGRTRRLTCEPWARCGCRANGRLEHPHEPLRPAPKWSAILGKMGLFGSRVVDSHCAARWRWQTAPAALPLLHTTSTSSRHRLGPSQPARLASTSKLFLFLPFSSALLILTSSILLATLLRTLQRSIASFHRCVELHFSFDLTSLLRSFQAPRPSPCVSSPRS